MDLEKLFQITAINKFDKLDIPMVANENCYHFKRFSEDKQTMISDNYVIYLTQTILGAYNNFSMDDYDEGFPHFQYELLDSVFFDYDDDKRWNIYLYIVYDNEDILNGIPIEKIEMDDNYALKSFVYIGNNKESLISLLSDKWFSEIIPRISESSDEIDIASVWEEELSRLDLKGFLENDRIPDNYVNNYIEGQSFRIVSTAKKISNKKIKPLHLDRIESLSFSGFREFCFGKELTTLFPGKMNIIYGINGSGKTSTLEAISSAITGYSVEKGCHAVIKSINGDTFDSQKVNAAACGKSWYNASIIQYSQLNRYFKIFNYFDYDRPYNFAKNKDENCEDLISNLFYDQNTIKMQKIIRRLAEKFKDAQKQYDDKISYLSNHLEEIEMKISTLRNDNDVTKINTELLSAINDTTYAGGLSGNNISTLALNVLIAAEPCKKAIDAAKPYIVNYEYASYANVQSEMISINERLMELQIFEEKYSPLIERKFNLEKEKNEAIIHLRDIDSVSKDVVNLRSLSRKLNIKSTSELRGLEEKYGDLLVTVNSAKNAYEKCKHYTDYVLLQLSERDNFDSRLKYLMLELNTSDKSRTNLKTSIEKLEQEAEYLNSLKSSINEMGKTLVAKNNIKSCPLCGSTYDSAQLLLKAMEESAVSLDSSKTNKYAENKQNLIEAENNINKIAKEISELKNNLQYLDLLSTLRDLLKKANLMVNISTIADININFDDKLQQLSTNKQTAKELEEVFISIMHSAKFTEFKNQLEDGLIQNSQNYIQKLKDAEDSNFTNILNNITENDGAIKALEKEMSGKGISNIPTQKKELIDKSYILKQALDLIEFSKNQFNITDDYDLIHWANNLSILEDKLNIYNKLLADNNEISRLEKDFDKDKKQLSRFIGFSNKCKEVQDVLNILPNTSDYAGHFIKCNKESIERLFLLIHRPREFDDVDFNQGNPVVNRKYCIAKVTPNQMSAGQKVSFALAVMFTLYLSAKSAPHILLLDEPVVNMDEMHFSNLVEILRELVLNGTQIFFTTANKEVLGYLKRKFSFLKNDLSVYEFDRDVNGSRVKIKQLYLQME